MDNDPTNSLNYIDRYYLHSPTRPDRNHRPSNTFIMNYGYIRETGKDLFVLLRNVDSPWRERPSAIDDGGEGGDKQNVFPCSQSGEGGAGMRDIG